MQADGTQHLNHNSRGGLGGWAQSVSGKGVDCDPADASALEHIDRSAWRLIVASLAIWRSFPSAFWLDPDQLRINGKRKALEFCWLGFVGAFFIVVVAPTWQLSYSMVANPGLEREILALPLTSLWNIKEEPRLEYIPNTVASYDAPWMQERIEDLWGDEVGVGWIDPLESEELDYYVNTMIDQEHLWGDSWIGRMLREPWFTNLLGIQLSLQDGSPPSWQWVFCCLFKEIIPSIRLVLVPLTAWLAIMVAMRLLVRRTSRAKDGIQCLRIACLIPIRYSWIGALLLAAAFFVAPDASRQLRSHAYSPLLVLAVAGPILVSLRPLWSAMRAFHPEWTCRRRVILMASTLLALTVLVGSIDFAARYTRFYFFLKTGRWIGETCNFSLWT
ncbi:MAG: hypothetical protein HS101_09570 [Planctomycetia bacterium]|jgi:hypothetical protein|nr:hypothetical protein [Planctomycetia bacterium]MCC7314824.1 hypothetical protein [Planctomycetota bacterium]OQZ06511.1 MAG: hypothetical protein B6D36_04580 [Planctomycetes bacterium UTPLA1]